MQDILIILFSIILVENLVLTKFLGLCPFIGVSTKIKTAMGMSGAVIFVMLIATMITWPLYHYVLTPLGLHYLQTLVFILVIASLVQVIEMVMKKWLPPLHRALGIYLPLITTNCAVLGITLLNINSDYTFLQSVFNSLGGGLGFMLALFLFAGIRMKIEQADIPQALRGLPITMISAALVAIPFYGFRGLIENILS